MITICLLSSGGVLDTVRVDPTKVGDISDAIKDVIAEWTLAAGDTIEIREED